jgi:hypothetical protein
MTDDTPEVKIARLEERVKAADKALSVALSAERAHARSNYALIVAVLALLGMLANWVMLLKH